jgi:hypothetical protein
MTTGGDDIERWSSCGAVDVMWNEIFKRWIDLLFWWVPKDEAKPSGEAKERTPSTTQQSAGRESEIVQQEVSDDLTVIRGIGQPLGKSCGRWGSRR